MRVTWGTDDIRVGRVVGKPGRGERWMIGYRATREIGDQRGDWARGLGIANPVRE